MELSDWPHVFGEGSGLVVVASGMLLAGAVMGCSTKNYVRAQTAPIVQNVNELDEKTAADHRAIGDTDAKAQAGIAGAMTAANTADQHAWRQVRRRIGRMGRRRARPTGWIRWRAW